MKLAIIFFTLVSLPLMASDTSSHQLSQCPDAEVCKTTSGFTAYLQQCKKNEKPFFEKFKQEQGANFQPFYERLRQKELVETFMQHLGQANDRPESRARVMCELYAYMARQDEDTFIPSDSAAAQL